MLETVDFLEMFIFSVDRPGEDCKEVDWSILVLVSLGVSSHILHSNAIFDMKELSVASSGHCARISRRSPLTRLDSARVLATSSLPVFSSHSFNHLLISFSTARASSPST